MALLDRLPGELKLYIGGLFTLRRKVALQEAGITHVLSVLRLPLEPQLFDGFTHKVVEVDDVEDENLLEHLPACNKFIQDGLDSGGAVFVHCAMGKSRSATVVCAYLMQHYHLSPNEALRHLREARPLCEPNDGFMSQLELWHTMDTPDDVEQIPVYQRWLYQREVALSRACGQAPDADKIRFEDEHQKSQTETANFELRCKKCRRALATSTYLSTHKPKTNSGDSSLPSNNKTASCAHYFLDPLSWMRPELEQGKLEGRLECPKCHTNVGKYAWQGMQCSCGEWIVPGISLARGRLDETRIRPSGDSTGDAASMGIRLPPGPSATPLATAAKASSDASSINPTLSATTQAGSPRKPMRSGL